jgi:hypothetical protein
MNRGFQSAMLSPSLETKMTFEEFKWAALVGLAAILVGIAGFMAANMWSLNEKLAVVVERVGSHDESIKEIKAELRARWHAGLPSPPVKE